MGQFAFLHSASSRRGGAATKWLCFLFSLGLSGVAAWWYLERQDIDQPGSGPTVELLDAGAQFDRLLSGRHSAQESEKASAGIEVKPGDKADFVAFLTELHTNYDKRGVEFHPALYQRHVPNFEREVPFAEHPQGKWLLRTNSSGLRNDLDVLPEKPAMRVVVTGDSHMDGICSNAESTAGVLRGLLPNNAEAEVLNAGVWGYNPYHYLGVVEHYGKELAPDWFVICVFGGNDLVDVCQYQRFYARRPPAKREPFVEEQLEAAGVKARGLGAQETMQRLYFLNNPEEEKTAITTLVGLSERMAESATRFGSKVLFVYLPSPFQGQPEHYAKQVQAYTSGLSLSPQQVAVTDRIAKGWLRELEQRNLHHLDLRTAFQDCSVCYWQSDSHLSLEGHQRAGKAIAAALID